MFRLVATFLLSFFLATTAEANSPRYCRYKFAPDEKIETRFMGLGYAMIMHALAEKYCGAKPISMEKKFLTYLEKQGCDSKTEIHQNTAVSVRRLEKASLTLMAADGDRSRSASKQEAKAWAKEAVEQLGGCQNLIELHSKDLDTWK